MRFLLFTLYAPMAAFGEVAVGERRMSWARPGRSAVLGLIAAALGRERREEAAHRELEVGLFYAVRTDAPGRPLVDYHTAQTPRTRKRQVFETRRAELEAGQRNTVLSTREWRTDCCFTVALWRRQNSKVDLEAVAAALKEPHFLLYAGRKAGPLGLPLNAEIIEADTFRAAFAGRVPSVEERAVLQRIRVPGVACGELAYDDDAPGGSENYRVERRRDAVSNRARWQFADRLERVQEGGYE